jgi:predicted MPP superfamily phosphohydrolase
MARVSVPQRRHSWARRALFATVETACRLAGGRHFYRAVCLTPPRLRVRREDVFVANLAAELDGFSIAQLTDFHAGPFLRARDAARVVEHTNRLEPDLIALTGDFITHKTEEVLELVPALGSLRARRGIFAVFGNHDYKGRREGDLERELGKLGIRALRNAHALVAPGLAVAGIEDLEEGKFADLDAALAAIPPGTAVVLLSHHPGGFELAAPRGVSLVLSGHTHGGQMRWPILSRLGPPHPGDRVERGGATLLVSHGIGAIGVPLRAGAPAEILLVKLRRGAPAAARAAP